MSCSDPLICFAIHPKNFSCKFIKRWFLRSLIKDRVKCVCFDADKKEKVSNFLAREDACKFVRMYNKQKYNDIGFGLDEENRLESLFLYYGYRRTYHDDPYAVLDYKPLYHNDKKYGELKSRNITFEDAELYEEKTKSGLYFGYNKFIEITHLLEKDEDINVKVFFNLQRKVDGEFVGRSLYSVNMREHLAEVKLNEFQRTRDGKKEPARHVAVPTKCLVLESEMMMNELFINNNYERHSDYVKRLKNKWNIDPFTMEEAELGVVDINGVDVGLVILD